MLAATAHERREGSPISGVQGIGPGWAGARQHLPPLGACEQTTNVPGFVAAPGPWSASSLDGRASLCRLSVQDSTPIDVLP